MPSEIVAEQNVLSFQYCPKLAVLNRDRTHVLLCRRKGEQDYDVALVRLKEQVLPKGVAKNAAA